MTAARCPVNSLGVALIPRHHSDAICVVINDSRYQLHDFHQAPNVIPSLASRTRFGDHYQICDLLMRRECLRTLAKVGKAVGAVGFDCSDGARDGTADVTRGPMPENVKLEICRRAVVAAFKRDAPWLHDQIHRDFCGRRIGWAQGDIRQLIPCPCPNFR
jgi:hypothetical protein